MPAATRPTTPDLLEVSRILKRHVPSEEYGAVLFGSRATGEARPGSDWDIGLVGPRALRGATVQRIRDELDELRTLHTFDVVDLMAAPDFFREAALRRAVRLI